MARNSAKLVPALVMIAKTNTVRNAGFQRSCDHDQVCNCFLTFVIRAWNALIAGTTGKKGSGVTGFGVGGLGRGNGVNCPDGAGGGVGASATASASASASVSGGLGLDGGGLSASANASATAGLGIG